MELSDLISKGVELFQNNVSEDGIDGDLVSEALSGLITNDEGGLDLSNILSSLGDENIGGILSSWIGSGDNEAIDGQGLSSLLGEEKIAEFADKLGIDSDSALGGLVEAIPNMIDGATGEGEGILDSLGGVDGLMDMAKKLF